jgi:hypothetical protein
VGRTLLFAALILTLLVDIGQEVAGRLGQVLNTQIKVKGNGNGNGQECPHYTALPPRLTCFAEGEVDAIAT